MSEQQTKLKLTEYTCGVSEELGGIIRVKASSEEEAQEIVEELINNFGLNDLFYASYSHDPDKVFKACEEAGVTWTKHYSGEREVFEVDEYPEV